MDRETVHKTFALHHVKSCTSCAPPCTRVTSSRSAVLHIGSLNAARQTCTTAAQWRSRIDDVIQNDYASIAATKAAFMMNDCTDNESPDIAIYAPGQNFGSGMNGSRAPNAPDETRRSPRVSVSQAPTVQSRSAPSSVAWGTRSKSGLKLL